MVINDKGNKITNKTALVFKSEYFKYIWSLNFGKNSGIKNSCYPSNYISAVKNALMNTLENIDIIVDIDDEEVKLAFEKAGIPIKEA